MFFCLCLFNDDRLRVCRYKSVCVCGCKNVCKWEFHTTAKFTHVFTGIACVFLRVTQVSSCYYSRKAYAYFNQDMKEINLWMRLCVCVVPLRILVCVLFRWYGDDTWIMMVMSDETNRDSKHAECGGS